MKAWVKRFMPFLSTYIAFRKVVNTLDGNKKGLGHTLGVNLIMGYGNIIHKQYVKGFTFLLLQILYIVYFFKVGIPQIIGLTTLGTSTQDWVFDEKLGINVLVDGDNSMLLLIYGVSFIIVTLIFIGIYLVYRSSYKLLQKKLADGHPVPTFMEDLRNLLDGQLHVTMLTPPFLGILIFTILPLVFMIAIGFTNYDHNHQPPGNLFTWVGLSNFANLFGLNAGATGVDKQMQNTFWPVLVWTMQWAVVATFSNYIFGILLAILINKKGIRYKKVWRTIFVTTIAVPQFVSLLLMRRLLGDYGPLNNFLLSAGFITERIPFLKEELLAKMSIIFVNLWIGIPFTMLITSGILMNIPRDMYEAASIDGASNWQMFRKITMPQVLFVTAPYLITQFIGNINNFNVIYLLTGGLPENSAYYGAGSTDLLVTWLFKLTAERKDYNLASTIGIIIFVISAIITLLSFRRMKFYKNEEDFS